MLTTLFALLGQTEGAAAAAATGAADASAQLAWPNLRAVLSPLILFGAGTAILVIDTFLRGWREPSKPGEKSGLYFLALLATLVAAALTGASAQAGEAGVYFDGALRVDRFTSAVSLFVLIATFLSLMSSVDYLHRRGIEHGEYHCLVLCAAAALILFAESNNLVMLFLSLETLSMAVYVLSSFLRDEKRGVEGGLKYFILGGFSAGFLLLGMAFLYAATGEIVLDRMVAARIDRPLFLAGLALIFVGLAFKVGAFPFHSWVPDAYEGAPAVVTGFMAVTVKVTTFAVILRLLASFVALPSIGGVRDVLVSILSLVALLTMVYGNLVALVQDSVKRMLAYSAIAHTGYLLVGIVASISAGDSGGGAAAVLFYFLPYSVMTLGAFTLLNFAGEGRSDRDLESFADYRGLAQERPALALGLLVILVSYAGLPPLAGFWAKLFIFREALATGHWVLALAGIVTSIVSVYYYLRLVVQFYMQPADPHGAQVGADARLASALVVGTAVAAIVLIGLFPGAFYEIARKSAATVVIPAAGG